MEKTPWGNEIDGMAKVFTNTFKSVGIGFRRSYGP